MSYSSLFSLSFHLHTLQQAVAWTCPKTHLSFSPLAFSLNISSTWNLPFVSGNLLLPFPIWPWQSLVSKSFAEVLARVNALLLSGPLWGIFYSVLHIQQCRMNCLHIYLSHQPTSPQNPWRLENVWLWFVVPPTLKHLGTQQMDFSWWPFMFVRHFTELTPGKPSW